MKTTYQRRVTFLQLNAVAAATLLLFSPAVTFSQNGNTEVRPPESPEQTNETWNRNGISIGRPKVFDNRTLTLMLESLAQSLASVQTTDSKALASALGNYQGYQATDTSFAASITGPTLNGVSKTTDLSTSPATITTKTTDSSGNTNSVTKNDPTNTSVSTDTKTSVTPSNQTPSVPTLASPNLDLGSSLQYGSNAGDLLQDQVNLQYQIFNLRMILQRSLTDRIWRDTTRRQAVLGFNVSLDPPSYAANSAAVVEVTISVPNTGRGDMSLIAVMPQEHTYNAAALNSKSNAFSGSAIAKVMNVGVAGRKTQKTMYLYRDNDTLSFENMARTESSSLEFGWVFRPVLGRKSVSPGMRQMFAVIALPAGSKDDPTDLVVKTRTYWKRYKAQTMTSSSASQTFGLDALRAKLSSSPELKPAYLNSTTYTNIRADSPQTTDDQLAPKVTGVDWTYTGATSVLVRIYGENFVSGTFVVMGGKTYNSPQNGLIIKSESAMDVLTDVASLLRSEGMVVGPYGSAQPLRNPATAASTVQVSGDLVVSVLPYKPLGTSKEVDITLNRTCESLLSIQSSTARRSVSDGVPGVPQMPFVLLDDTIVSDRALFMCEAGKNALIRTVVPNSLFANKAVVARVIFPFTFPSLRSETYQVPDYDKSFEIERIDGNATSFFLRADSNTGFEDLFSSNQAIKNRNHKSTDPCWTLQIGPKTAISLPARKQPSCGDNKTEANVKEINDYLMLITDLRTNEIFKDRFILIDPEGYDVELSLPAAKQEAPKPSIATTSVSINQNDAVWVTVTGTGLAAISSAKMNGSPVEIRLLPKAQGAAADAKDSLQVNVPSAVSAKAGTADISLYDASSKIIGIVPIRIACTSCIAK